MSATTRIDAADECETEAVEAVAGFLVFAVGLTMLAGLLRALARSTTTGEPARDSGFGIATTIRKSSAAAWQAAHPAARPWPLAAARIGYVAGGVTAAIASAG